MGGCFAENRHMVFFWKLSEKGACDVLLERTLKKTHDVWKGYKYNPTDSELGCMVLVRLAILCWSSFVVTTEREMHQRTSGGVLVGFLPLPRTPANGRVMSAETDACAEARHTCGGKTGGHMMFGESISRIQQTVALLTLFLAGYGHALWLVLLWWRPGCFCWMVPLLLIHVWCLDLTADILTMKTGVTPKEILLIRSPTLLSY